MPMLEKLRVEYYREEHGVMPLTAFLRAAPQLQEFSISQVVALTYSLYIISYIYYLCHFYDKFFLLYSE